MGLESWVKEWLEHRFSGCFDFDGPGKDLGTLSKDEMMDMKGGNLPDYIKTQNQMVQYFLNKIIGLFDQTNIVIACFDRESPDVKRMVCHVTRYERRCALCKKKAELPRGQVAGPEYFDPQCTKGCIDNQMLWAEQGPYMHPDDDCPLRFDWRRFSADSRNLHRELYPRLANALLTMWRPRPGQQLFLHGLPFKTRQVFEYDGQPFRNGVSLGTKRVIIEPWTIDYQVEPDDFKHTVMIAAESGGSAQIIPEMQNDILEADNAVYFYSRFFPHVKKHMAYINDGDAIPIGLFRTLEDFRGPNLEDGPEQWLALPYLSKKKKAMLKGNPGIQYVNLTKLADKIENAPEFRNASVQSPVATVIFLMILAGTDFFKGEFCFGIGGKTEWNEDEEKRNRQTKGIWDTFFDKMEMFRHLVQYYPNVKSLVDKRRVVIDEDLFRIFTEYCYMNKYATAAEKKKKKEVSFEDIRMHCAAMSDPRKRVPEDAIVQRWARQITWNLEYWANAFRNIYIDPFERHEDQSYYGYEKDDAGMRIVNVVASKQKPLDEVYKRNFWKRKQKPGESIPEPISEKKKSAALDAIRGK